MENQNHLFFTRMMVMRCFCVGLLILFLSTEGVKRKCKIKKKDIPDNKCCFGKTLYHEGYKSRVQVGGDNCVDISCRNGKLLTSDECGCEKKTCGCFYNNEFFKAETELGRCKSKNICLAAYCNEDGNITTSLVACESRQKEKPKTSRKNSRKSVNSTKTQPMTKADIAASMSTELHTERFTETKQRENETSDTMATVTASLDRKQSTPMENTFTSSLSGSISSSLDKQVSGVVIATANSIVPSKPLVDSPSSTHTKSYVDTNKQDGIIKPLMGKYVRTDAGITYDKRDKNSRSESRGTTVSHNKYNGKSHTMAIKPTLVVPGVMWTSTSSLVDQQTRGTSITDSPISVDRTSRTQLSATGSIQERSTTFNIVSTETGDIPGKTSLQVADTPDVPAGCMLGERTFNPMEVVYTQIYGTMCLDTICGNDFKIFTSSDYYECHNVEVECFVRNKFYKPGEQIKITRCYVEYCQSNGKPKIFYYKSCSYGK